METIAGARILVVDDAQVNVLIAQKFLTKWGAEVDIARNGVEAVEKFKSNCYNLILMDVHMPEMSGPEASHIIRSFEEQCGGYTPIMAITADYFIEPSELIKHGINDFILKPFKPEELKSKLMGLLSLKRASG